MSDDASTSEPGPSIGFRKVKKKPSALRTVKQRPVEENEDNEDDICRKLADIHEVQMIRKRRNGMTALECALGKKMASQFDEMEDDPFRMRDGRMMTLSEDKKMKLTAEDITTGIKEQFHKEELLFDEDEEMKKYIEANLDTKQPVVAPKDSKQTANTYIPIEDQILLKAAEKLRGFRSKEDDEILSNQMLAGIPEVDLGIEARMKNVLDTEKVKSYMAANNGKPPPSDEPKPKKYKRFRID